MKKKNIGNKLAHVGIIGHDRILVSMSDKHYTNQGIIKSWKLSINLIDGKMLPKADYVGGVSGENVDKTDVFGYHGGENGSQLLTHLRL